MTTEPAAPRRNNKSTIEIAGTDLVFRAVDLDTRTPTGGQIAKIAGLVGDQHPYVLQWLSNGDFEDIRVHEEADLDKGTKFVVAESSRSNRITIDDEQIDWPADVITGAVIRKLGRIPAEKSIYLEREDEPDRLIEDHDVIRIKPDGIEEFKSRKPETWELIVQGKKIISISPVISVVEALTRAGFDPNAWLIFLKVEGQPKRQLAVVDSVDLRAKGVEKIRLTPKDVNNGEARAAARRDFALLAGDQTYLDDLGLSWETDAAEGRRWLIIHDYPVPAGYTVHATTLALLVPPTYPQAEIDMFFVHPTLHRSSGGIIAATESQQTIRGLSFQRWSRHRGPGARWNPAADSVVTHLALVDTALAKEVGE